jgi:hypothetical protein
MSLTEIFDRIAVKEGNGGKMPEFHQVDIDTRYKIYKKKFNDDDDDDDNYELVEISNNLILWYLSFQELEECKDGREHKRYSFKFYKVDGENIKKIEEDSLNFWKDIKDKENDPHMEDDPHIKYFYINIDTCFDDIDTFIKIDDDHTVYESEYGLNSLAGGKTKKTKQHRRKTMKRKTKKGGKQNKTKGVARRRRQNRK